MQRLVLAAALSLAAAAASAQPSPQDMQACKPDYQRFCAAVSPGGGRILNCLRDHGADLSAACKAVIEQQAK